MKIGRFLATALALAGAELVLMNSAALAAGPDLRATAQTLVNQSGNIKEGDAVLISGTPRDIELLENIAVEVRKLGAFPLISLGSEGLGRRMYDEVAAKWDAQTPEFEVKLVNLITATISINSTESPAAMTGVPPERIAARSKAGLAIMETMLKRNVRQVSLGNGLYPTMATARQYGMPQEELAKMFWAAVNTDYSTLQSNGDKVRATLAAGKEIQITNPNGTDLKFRIEKRPIFVSDGVISKEDISQGGPACQVWLPAGEVYTTPVLGSAEGKVFVDRHFFQGQEISGVVLTFKAGKLSEMTAKTGLDPLMAAYKAATGDKDAFALVDIGINESMNIPKDSKLLSWIPARMVTIGFGENTWAGGTNKSSFDFSGFLPGSTLKVDGKTLIENGKLRL